MVNDATFILYNVNSIVMSQKCNEVIRYLCDKQADVILLQEMHITQEQERWFSTQWGSKIWFSNGSSNSKGIAVLFSKIMQIQVHNVIKSENSRYIILYLTLFSHKFVIANIYTPNKDKPAFFKKVSNEIHKFSPDFFIIGGDFNLALDPRVDRQGSNTNNDQSADVVRNYINANQLVDAWRFCNSDKSGFTWRCLRPKPIFSRLDYFVISESFTQFVEELSLWPGFQTDHSIVCMKICFSSHRHGPGYWKLNTSLLRDQDYVSSMNNLIDIQLGLNQNKTYKEQLELLKLVAQGSSVQFGARKQKSKRNKLQVLEKKLKTVESELPNRSVFIDAEHQIALIKHEINEINRQRTDGAMLRSKTKHLALGEKTTKYCLNLEKQNCHSKTLLRLKADNDQILTEPQSILSEIQKFYQKLYKMTGQVDLSYLDKLNLPKISEEDKNRLEAPIMQDEIAKALLSMPNNKSPGVDGLPPDWYKVFYHKIKDLLLNVYTEIVQDGLMHLTAC